ncbi:MAG: GspE/PulE family protein [Firmicutes bacterium]|nr:GspE/PulE family protein [Bacillota bacterium]
MVFGWKKKDETDKGDAARAVREHGEDTALEQYPKIDLGTLDLDRGLAKLLDEAISKKIEGIVIGKPDDHTLVIAVKDPTQIYIHDSVAYVTHSKFRITLVAADSVMVDLALEYIYTFSELIQDVPWKEWLEKKRFEGKQLEVKKKAETLSGEKEEITGTIVDKANRIIVEAISVGASDIHLEPFEDRLLVRYRIDGVLNVSDVITDKEMIGALIKRFKIMADIDIAQERITQGGRISVRVSDRAFDLRVSIIPVQAGEGIVMRLLSKSAFNISLENLGFDAKLLKIWRKMVARPYGIILVSGPTGSGKSTTLFASLKEINRPDRKILTVEDPIEYQMPGIMQVQVNLAPKEEERKVTFAKALREFLRQDPDVILVGEIRDEETAAISVKAALTGHLVFSTIHTNDSVGIINRLKDMGVIPYLISSSFIGGVAQRLVRRLCPECKEPDEVPSELISIMEKHNIIDRTFFKAKGCERCRRSGYRGRIGLYEMLVLDEDLQSMIEADSLACEISKKAREKGMVTLMEDGVRKAAQGVTSADEVMRVCKMDISM